MTYATTNSRDRAIADAKKLAEEDTAAVEDRATKDVEDLKEETDNLLDEIDSILEETAIQANFRQKGGE
jgi:ribosome recycling factor